jgi:hypothetical protein
MRNNVISLPWILIILGCIGIIDKTLVKLWRSWYILLNIPNGSTTGRRCTVWTIVVWCVSLPIHLDLDYTITLTQCDHYLDFMIVGLWLTHFTNMEKFFEYLLGDLGHLGAYMFIMRRIDHQENSHGNKQKHTHHIQLHAFRLPHLSQPCFCDKINHMA